MGRFFVVLSLILASCAAIPHAGGVFRTPQGQTIRWNPEDFPLRVMASERMNIDQLSNLAEAMAAWNEAIGAEVFVPDSIIAWDDPEWIERRQGTIYVTPTSFGAGNSSSSLQGMTSIEWRGRRYYHMLVSLDEEVAPEEQRIVLLHELGHCLGLDHDSQIMSIMYRYATSSGGLITSIDRYFVIWQMTEAP